MFSGIDACREAEYDRWRMRLAVAEGEYREAASRYQRLSRNLAGAAPCDLPELASAHSTAIGARAEFLRILRIFKDLVLYNRSPR